MNYRNSLEVFFDVLPKCQRIIYKLPLVHNYYIVNTHLNLKNELVIITELKCQANLSIANIDVDGLSLMDRQLR